MSEKTTNPMIISFGKIYSMASGDGLTTYSRKEYDPTVRCELCPRTFATKQGHDRHRREYHR